MAGKIPRDFIDDLLSRTDVVDVVDSRVKLKKAGKNYQACCPFHNEKSPSFTVSQDKQCVKVSSERNTQETRKNNKTLTAKQEHDQENNNLSLRDTIKQT